MESGESVERDKIIFRIIYNQCNVDIGKIMKDEYLHLQTEKAYYGAPSYCIYKKSNLIDISVSTRLPTNPVTL